MSSLDQALSAHLTRLREAGLYRELRQVDSPQSSRIKIAGQTLLNFSSNDYLGLADEPALKDASRQALERFGAGTGAARLVSGSLAPHPELEETLARFKSTEAALSFATGYAAALGTICALLGKNDFIVIDKLVHACIVDAARLCGAKLRVFAHNDLNDLADILKWADGQRAQSQISNLKPQILVVTESVFSMDGDHAPLRELVALKEKHGAWLMVDEAHATGLYGKNRRGLAEAQGVSDRIEIQMGTLGKAIGASGGYICGSRVLVDFLVNCARTFIFSTAPVPAAAAAATAGIRFIQSPDGDRRCRALWQRVEELDPRLKPHKSEFASAIQPLIIGNETKALETAAALRQQSIFVPAIRYPTVARGTARLRFTTSAAHSVEDIRTLNTALAGLKFPPLRS
jgi:8-amino-7-oxononanoate synthase